MSKILPTLILALLLTACVQRTITVDSDPRGALVYLNDEEVGRTPVTVPFTFYGTYDVRLEKEGYRTFAAEQEAKGPWWESPGPDLLAEAVPNNKVRLDWFYTLTPTPPVTAEDEQALLDRAQELRGEAEGAPPEPKTEDVK